MDFLILPSEYYRYPYSVILGTISLFRRGCCTTPTMWLVLAWHICHTRTHALRPPHPTGFTPPPFKRPAPPTLPMPYPMLHTPYHTRLPHTVWIAPDTIPFTDGWITTFSTPRLIWCLPHLVVAPFQWGLL